MVDRRGCTCAAQSENECGCPNVDWTPWEIYNLQKALKRIQAAAGNPDAASACSLILRLANDALRTGTSCPPPLTQKKEPL